jgi:hypothetical protein
MLRCARYALAAFSVFVVLAGCETSEIKNTNDIGLAKDVPSGSISTGYGDGRGDSIGGGGAAAPLDPNRPAEQTGETEGH